MSFDQLQPGLLGRHQYCSFRVAWQTSGRLMAPYATSLQMIDVYLADTNGNHDGVTEISVRSLLDVNVQRKELPEDWHHPVAGNNLQWKQQSNEGPFMLPISEKLQWKQQLKDMSGQLASEFKSRSLVDQQIACEKLGDPSFTL